MNCKHVKHYIFGEQSLDELPELLNARRKPGSDRAVLVIDHFFQASGVIRQRLSQDSRDVWVYADTRNEPHADYVTKMFLDIQRELGTALPVAVVGIGGGSSMDIAKCLSALFTNPLPLEQYQGWDLVKNPGIYKIGIPTLSGTGAEATRTAVITSRVRKLGLNSDFSVFDQVILDPTLSRTVPLLQFFYTAMDCFVHDVESLRGSQIDAMSRAYAETSLQLLRECFAGEIDRGKLMTASYFGGVAVANTNVGICHPLSYGLSLVLGMHHGESICVAFEQLEEYYGDYVRDYRRFRDRLGVDIPRGIMRGVSDADLDTMAEATLKNEKPLTNAFGPAWRDVFTKEKVLQLLRKM